MSNEMRVIEFSRGEIVTVYPMACPAYPGCQITPQTDKDTQFSFAAIVMVPYHSESKAMRSPWCIVVAPKDKVFGPLLEPHLTIDLRYNTVIKSSMPSLSEKFAIGDWVHTDFRVTPRQKRLPFGKNKLNHLHGRVVGISAKGDKVLVNFHDNFVFPLLPQYLQHGKCKQEVWAKIPKDWNNLIGAV